MRYKAMAKYFVLVALILLFSVSVSGDIFRRYPREPAPNPTIDEFEKDEQVKEMRKELLMARYKNEIETLEENKRIVNNVNKIGYVVFAIAHILLVLAVAASVHEFIHASKTRKKKPDHHEIQVSLEGIALRSSLHGVVLLVVAILFYFLFLKYVLPFDSSRDTVTIYTEASKPPSGQQPTVGGSDNMTR